ncbi:autotransporter outer membrane beta-barrel domain-containing protein, partial [Roseobacter sp. HKCCD9056]
MRSQSSDTQPALRPLNVSVRGGRLTKIKGRVAGIAPGLSVVATAAVTLAGGADQAAAQALNACGPDAPGQDTATCDAPTDPGTNPYADGITYNNSDGLTLILNEDDITVRGSGARVVGSTSGEGDISMHLQNGKVITDGSAAFAPGLFAQIKNEESTASVTAQVGKGGEVNTVGLHHYGVLVSNSGLGAATAEMDGDAVTTHGANTHALFAEIENEESTATATARLIKGEITTTGGTEAAPGVFGLGAHGLFAQTAGDGAALAQMDGGAITTSGASARGLYAETRAGESTATVTARLTKGDISTGGRGADGLHALTLGTGAALAQMDGGTITTSGASARGLEAWIFNSDSSATVTARMTKGDINTGGGEAYGLDASTFGTGAALAQMEGGTVTTLGEDAYGLFALSRGGQAKAILGTDATVRVYGADADGIRAGGATGFDVDVAGEVTGGAGNGAAIRAFFLLGSPPPSDASGTIDIASTGKVTAGLSGYAIQVDGSGAAVITSAGTIEGDIRLGAGNDILTLAGGSFTGNLYVGDGDDTVTISATTVYDSSKILDGGAGDDRLTLHGQTLTTMENLRNWEHLTLAETELSLEGVGTLEAGLSIEAGSEFRVTGGGRGAPTGAPSAGHVASASGEGMTIRGDVINAGAVTLSVQDGKTGDVITIDGDYTNTGSGKSAFVLDTVLEGAGFATDRLVITGDTSGEIGLSLAGLDSAGAEVTELEIDVVSVGGASNGTFRLMDGNYVTSDGEHAVIAGAYLYRLAETADGWALSALSSTGEVHYGPSAPIHDSYGASLLAFNAPSALRGRGSSQDFRTLAWGGAGADAAGQDTGAPLWIQMGTEQLTSAAEQSTTGAARDSSLWEMEIGADLVLSESAAGLFVGGLMLSYGTGSTDVSSGFGDGSIETTGLGLGLAATWYDTRGFYVDGQVTVTSYSSDL